MKCPRCGRDLPDNAKFCAGCGESLNPGKTKKQAAAEERAAKRAGRISLKAPVIALVITMLMLVAAIFFIFYDGGSEDSPKETKEPEATAEPAGEAEYKLDDIEKKKSDTGVMNGLAGDEGSSAAVREEIAQVENAMDIAEQELRFTPDEEGNPSEYAVLTEDNIYGYLYRAEDYLYDLESEGVISGFTREDTCIIIDLSDGGSYIYAPELEGYDAGAQPVLNVATYQPCLDGYAGGGAESFMHLIDDGAGLIDSSFDAYVFDNGGGSDADYNNGEVIPASCIEYGQYHVVLWHGHGAYSEDYGSLLVIGIERNDENDRLYKKALDNHAMFYGDDCYFVGPEFFSRYLEDGALENTVVYLGACSSAKDSRLGDALIAKGAVAVYGNDDVIHTTYNLRMIYAVCEGLCQTYSDGSHYSVSEALEYAKDKEGESDTGDCSAEVVLNTTNKNFALDWYEDEIVADRDVVLVLDVSGSMDGEPLDETVEAAHGFVDTVLDNQAMIGLVTYSDYASLEVDFTRRQAILDNAIDDIYSQDMTNTEDGLRMAADMLRESDAEKKIIVLMTDGLPNEGLEGDALIRYAEELREEGIYIYTLGFFQNMTGEDIYYAQRLLEGMASDGCHYEVDDASNLVYFFGDIADQINGQHYIYIKIACPVDVTVKYDGETLSSDEDKLNTRTSFGSLTFENVNDEDYYDDYYDEEDDEDRVKILRLKDGVEYDISIRGTGYGTMDYTIGLMDDKGEYADFRSFENINITDLTRIDTVASSSAEKTVLSVDADGDGKYDIEYEAGPNGYGQVVEHSSDVVLWCIAGAGLLGAVISAVIISVRVKRRRAAA